MVWTRGFSLTLCGSYAGNVTGKYWFIVSVRYIKLDGQVYFIRITMETLS
jgi:hypothetical protein